MPVYGDGQKDDEGRREKEMSEEWLIWSDEYAGWLDDDQAKYGLYRTDRDLAREYTFDEAVEICRVANGSIGRSDKPIVTMIPLACLP